MAIGMDDVANEQEEDGDFLVVMLHNLSVREEAEVSLL